MTCLLQYLVFMVGGWGEGGGEGEFVQLEVRLNLINAHVIHSFRQF